MEIWFIRRNKTEFLPSSSCINTTVWMQPMDSNKSHREKARWELRKNITWDFEQFLETDTHKTATVFHILQTIQVRRTRHSGYCWKNMDELISDVFLLTPAHGHANVGRPAKIYLHQSCVDAGCCLVDLSRAVDDWDR